MERALTTAYVIGFPFCGLVGSLYGSYTEAKSGGSFMHVMAGSIHGGCIGMMIGLASPLAVPAIGIAAGMNYYVNRQNAKKKD